MSLISIGGLGPNVDGNLRLYLATCSTAPATQAKEITVDGLTALETGDTFVVIFSSGQTYNGAPTLNVNSLGAANIRRLTGTNAGQYEWVAGQILTLVYDGTNFVIENGGIAGTTYYGKTKLSSSVSSTSEALAATPKAVKTVYDIVTDHAKVLINLRTTLVQEIEEKDALIRGIDGKIEAINGCIDSATSMRNAIMSMETQYSAEIRSLKDAVETLQRQVAALAT